MVHGVFTGRMATGNENESGSDLTIDLYKDVYIKFGSLDRDEDGGLQVDQQGRLAIFFEVQCKLIFFFKRENDSTNDIFSCRQPGRP